MRLTRSQLAFVSCVSGLAAVTAVSAHFASSSVFGPTSAEPELTSSALRAEAAVIPVLEVQTSPASDLVRRPLFTASRREFTPPTPAPPSETPAAIVYVEEPPPPSYVVGGVVVTPLLRKILLKREVHGTGRWLSQGQSTEEGWLVVSVTSGGGELARGARKIELKLHEVASGN